MWSEGLWLDTDIVAGGRLAVIDGLVQHPDWSIVLSRSVLEKEGVEDGSGVGGGGL